MQKVDQKLISDRRLLTNAHLVINHCQLVQFPGGVLPCTEIKETSALQKMLTMIIWKSAGL